MQFDKRAFPRGLKPCQFTALVGAAEAAPFQSKGKLGKPRPVKANANCTTTGARTHSHGFRNRVTFLKRELFGLQSSAMWFPRKRNPMLSLLRSLFNDEPGSTKAKIISIYALLAGFNLGAWI